MKSASQAIEVSGQLCDARIRVDRALGQLRARLDPDRDSSSLTARTNPSWRSWGEIVSVQMSEISSGSVHVELHSVSVVRSTVFDFGKNRDNVRALAAAIASAEPAVSAAAAPDQRSVVAADRPGARRLTAPFLHRVREPESRPVVERTAEGSKTPSPRLDAGTVSHEVLTSPQSEPIPIAAHAGRRNALSRRLLRLQIASGLVLAGFLLNAGLFVVMVAWITHSEVVSLTCLGLMAVAVVVLALASERIFLRATGARPLRKGEYPWLAPMVSGLAGQVGIVTPIVLVADDDNDPNAYTTGAGNRRTIVFKTALLELLPRDEIRAVAAHELGHVVSRDVSIGVWTWAVFIWVVGVGTLMLLLAQLLIGASKALIKETFGGVGLLGLLVWWFIAALALFFGALLWIATHIWIAIAKVSQLMLSREREFLADATAAAITGEPHTLSSALGTLDGAARDAPRGAATVGQFCIVNPLKISGWLEAILETHPSTQDRVEELERLAGESLPAIDGSWRGVGTFAWSLPAGSLLALLLLAVLVPVCR